MRRQRLETRYLSLPPAEQTVLHEQATQNLLRHGMRREFLLEPLIKGEVYRSLEKQDVQQGADQLAVRRESHSGGLEGGQLPTAVAEVCG